MVVMIITVVITAIITAIVIIVIIIEYAEYYEFSNRCMVVHLYDRANNSTHDLVYSHRHLI